MFQVSINSRFKIFRPAKMFLANSLHEAQRLMLTYGWELEASVLSPVNAKTKIGKTWLSANLPSWKLAFVVSRFYFSKMSLMSKPVKSKPINIITMAIHFK